MNETDPHAVRWAIRDDRFRNPQWSKWHWTEDANRTVCGHVIRIFEVDGSPECDESSDRVDCKLCISVMQA